MPPIDELTRIEPVHLDRLMRQGVFTTGLLLEVSETPTRRQTLADQVDASTNDVLSWRDESQMLNFAGFGPTEHQLLMQSGFEGLADILAVEEDWRWSGTHYRDTARWWLKNFDDNAPAVRRILADVYGKDAALWSRRWRLFFPATEGLFGYADGKVWGVSHYRLKPA